MKKYGKHDIIMFVYYKYCNNDYCLKKRGCNLWKIHNL